jgi:hydroxyacylglutathione hydrolase
MNIKTLVLGIVQTNCYIVSNSKTSEAIIIDPSSEEETIKEYVLEKNLNVVGIFITHGHFDHIMAAKSLQLFFGVKLYAGIFEKEMLEDDALNCSLAVGACYTMKADIYLEDGYLITMAGMKIRVIHTPGHTAGGVCYHFVNQKVLFSGDTLFFESIGRSDMPTGNGNELLMSVKEKLWVLDDEIQVYPGHGRGTTIGYEKKNNPYISGWE